MLKSMSLSSDGSLDDADSVSSDELLGSQSRRWLNDLMTRDMTVEDGHVNTIGVDGLFVDHHFPRGELEMQSRVEWKRPKELCTSPQFIVDGASRLDVRQGDLNDCWLLSAISSLSLHHFLLQKVMPPGQGFQEGYNGCFTFRFWQYGQWEEVRIDDLLPTRHNKLIYLSSPERHEFWSSLLEKAYAKMKGGYRALDMGYPHEAMVDMTGGVTEVYSVGTKRNLSSFLRQQLAKGALINCANCQGTLEKKSELGIMFKHAYSLTAIEKVNTANGTQELIRIQNPWGDTEWEGPWSDLKGPQWNTVSIEEQQRLGVVRREDGEFWMSVSDFRQNFEIMEVCHLTDGLTNQGSRVLPWCCTMHHGNWVPRISAGGPPQGRLFGQNPQFYFTLAEADSDADESQKTCSFILALMQKHQRLRGVNLFIALDIYPANPNTSHLSPEDLSALQPVLRTSQYSSRREVVLRGSLPPGHYVIIPSTSKANQQGAFLLRVLTEPGNTAISASKPSPQDISSGKELSYPHRAALPSLATTRHLFKKHCNKKGQCKPAHLHSLLTEALQEGVLAGSEKYLALEHCKSLVVLMDWREFDFDRERVLNYKVHNVATPELTNQILALDKQCQNTGNARLNWDEFQSLWDKIRRWTDIFLVFDKNKTNHLEYKEVEPALNAAGIVVDELVMQLVGLRYTELDMTISYPGFLYLLMKLESMIQVFQAYDMAGMGRITLDYKQWLHMTMYN